MADCSSKALIWLLMANQSFTGTKDRKAMLCVVPYTEKEIQK